MALDFNKKEEDNLEVDNNTDEEENIYKDFVPDEDSVEIKPEKKEEEPAKEEVHVGYKEKEYKTDSLDTNTVKTNTSNKSRLIILIAFYAFVFIALVVVVFMILTDKYQFYFKDEKIVLSQGSSYQVELIPKNAGSFDYLNYKYSIADESVATVDEFGTVTAVGTGTTDLKVSMKYGLVSKKMTISTEDIYIESIDLKMNKNDKMVSVSNIDMSVNDTVTLFAYANGRDDMKLTVSYSSSDTSVAKVDEFGNVVAKSEGEAIITATRDDASAEVVVNVTSGSSSSSSSNAKVTKVSIGITQTTAYVGDTLPLKVKYTPSNAKANSIKWTSNNTKVATVSGNGVVTMKSAGTATITVEVDGVKSSGKIIVKKKNSSGTATPKPTAKPTTNPTTNPSTPKPTTSPAVNTFASKYVKFSTQSVTVSKGKTATFKIKVYNAAGVLSINSSNTGIAKVDKTSLWFDGVDEDTGKPYWVEKTVTVTGVKAGTTKIVITPDSEQGMTSYDTKSGTTDELLPVTGKAEINITVK